MEPESDFYGGLVDWAQNTVTQAIHLYQANERLHRAEGGLRTLMDLEWATPGSQRPESGSAPLSRRLDILSGALPNVAYELSRAKVDMSFALGDLVTHARGWRIGAEPLTAYPEAWIDALPLARRLAAVGFPEPARVQPQELVLLLVVLTRLERFFDLDALEIRATSGGWLFGARLEPRLVQVSDEQNVLLTVVSALFPGSQLSTHRSVGHLRLRFTSEAA